MTEAIFEHLKHELGEAGHDITRLFRHGRYHQPTPGTTVPEETTMDLARLEQDIRGDVEAAKAKAEEVWNHSKSVLEQHLPQLAAVAQQAASNPLVDAALSAVHLSPGFLTSIAELVTKAEAELAAIAPQNAPEPPAAPAAGEDTPEPAEAVSEPAAAAQ